MFQLETLFITLSTTYSIPMLDLTAIISAKVGEY